MKKFISFQTGILLGTLVGSMVSTLCVFYHLMLWGIS